MNITLEDLILVLDKYSAVTQKRFATKIYLNINIMPFNLAKIASSQLFHIIYDNRFYICKLNLLLENVSFGGKGVLLNIQYFLILEKSG